MRALLAPFIGICVVGLSCGSVTADEQNDLSKLWTEGRPLIDVRLRYEMVDEEGFTDNAHGTTLRTRIGFKSGKVYDTEVLVDFENIVTVGNDDFNSTTNGITSKPTIADPEITEVNRAQVTYTGIPDTEVTLGRQRIILNNQRFVGNVGFRQNEQTFDAFRVENASLPVTFNYIYIARVHRIFGDDNPVGDFDSDSHVVQADVALGPFGNLSVYGLALDFDEAPAQSSVTTGVRSVGDHRISRRLALTHEIEYARQWDYGSNPFDYVTNYAHAAFGAKSKYVNAKVGYEVLGGDGLIGFSTPLSTLHKFQGLADAFLVTPVGGIKDLYVQVGGKLSDLPFGKRLSGAITVHDFQSEEFDAGLGHEVDARLDLAVDRNWSVHLQGALYEDGDAGPASRNKIWAAARFRY